MNLKEIAQDFAEKNRSVVGLAQEVVGDDENKIAKYSGLYAKWDGVNVPYEAGIIVFYNGNPYKCVQAHTSQPGWSPEAAPSLWARIGNPAEEWPEWIQPTGGHDAYSKGDKVTYGGKHYTSLINANVWSPIDNPAGWQEEQA